MRSILSRWLLAATVAGCAAVLAQPTAPHVTPASAYIVQSHGTQSAVRIVRGVGGRITHELPIIHGVSAMLTPAQAARLRQLGTVDLLADAAVTTQDHSDSYRSSTTYSSTTYSSTTYSSTSYGSTSYGSTSYGSTSYGSTSYSSGSSSSTVPNQDARAEIGADRLAAQGFNGTGVTVAVLDTGLPPSWVQ